MGMVPLDHPIYTRRFVIGGMRSSAFLRSTAKKEAPSSPLSKEIEDWADKGIWDAAEHQMGSPQGDLSDSPTGAPEQGSKS